MPPDEQGECTARASISEKLSTSQWWGPVRYRKLIPMTQSVFRTLPLWTTCTGPALVRVNRVQTKSGRCAFLATGLVIRKGFMSLRFHLVFKLSLLENKWNISAKENDPPCKCVSRNVDGWERTMFEWFSHNADKKQSSFPLQTRPHRNKHAQCVWVCGCVLRLSRWTIEFFKLQIATPRKKKLIDALYLNRTIQCFYITCQNKSKGCNENSILI